MELPDFRTSILLSSDCTFGVGGGWRDWVRCKVKILCHSARFTKGGSMSRGTYIGRESRFLFIEFLVKVELAFGHGYLCMLYMHMRVMSLEGVR